VARVDRDEIGIIVFDFEELALRVGSFLTNRIKEIPGSKNVKRDNLVLIESRSRESGFNHSLTPDF
jgi:transcriptional regulator of aromatic amino acid metabolism